MSKPIVFYDIPSHAKGRAWSHNAWRTRFCLNIKGIPYRTVWVEYPDIKPLCEKIGASHTSVRADGSPYYTLPVIHNPNTNETVSDSAAIVRYLDRTFPDTPRLVPEGTDEAIGAFQRAFYQVYEPEDVYRPLIVPAVYARLREGSRPYFLETREKALRGKFEDLAPAGSAKRAELFEGFKKGSHKAATQWYQEDGKEKLLFMGDDIGITFADVVVASFFMWFKAAFGEESEDWKEIMSWDNGLWSRILATFEKYAVADEGEDAIL